MREVAADAGALLIDVVRRLHVMGVLIAEGRRADARSRRSPAPAPNRAACLAEQRPGDVGEPVGLAVAARHQIEQHVVGQLLDRQLLRGRHDDIRPSGIAHQRLAAQGDAAGGRDETAADIAKTVAIEADRNVGFGNDPLGADDVGIARGMDREHDHHRRRLRRGVGNLEADLDLHAQNFCRCHQRASREAHQYWLFTSRLGSASSRTSTGASSHPRPKRR